MQPIGSLLRKSAKKYKIEDKIRVYEIVRNWEKIVTDCLPEAAGKTMAVSLEKGVLRIAALTKDIADIIYMLQKRILYAINSMFHAPVVYRISCEY